MKQWWQKKMVTQRQGIIQTTCLIIIMACLVGGIAGNFIGKKFPLNWPISSKGMASGKQFAHKAIKSGEAHLENPEAQLIEFTSRVRSGDEAHIFFRTQPGQVCTFRYVIVPMKANMDLAPPSFQVTNDAGVCGWRWKIPTDYEEGSLGTVFAFVAGATKQYAFIIIP